MEDVEGGSPCDRWLELDLAGVVKVGSEGYNEVLVKRKVRRTLLKLYAVQPRMKAAESIDQQFLLWLSKPFQVCN